MSKNQSENVEVILTLSPDHYRMIKRCATVRNISIEQWILEATEGDLRGETGKYGYSGVKIGFEDGEVTEVINALHRDAANV